MSNDSPAVLTRSAVIRQRTRQAIAASGLNVLKFASRVAEKYVAAVMPLDRTIDFYESGHTIESAARAELANGKLIDRYLKGVVRFPVDLEELWIDVLPEPHRSDLIRELAHRYGLIGAQLPASEPHEHMARIADVLRDAGRTAQLVAPMFQGGKLDVHAESGQRVMHALVQIDRSIADLISFKEQIKAQLPGQPRQVRRR